MKKAFIQSLSALAIDGKALRGNATFARQIGRRMKTVFKRTARRWCVPFVLVALLTGCASTPEQEAAEGQRRFQEKTAEEQRRFTEKQSKEDREQKRWQQTLAPYSDEQLRFKYAGLEQAVARGTEGMNILLAQGNGIGVLIAQGQLEAKVKERDAVGLELVRRGAGTSKPPPGGIPPGNDSTRLKGNGSGFFITEDGYLLTNFHVVNDASAVKVKYHGKLYDAEVVRKDKGADLAVLKVTGNFKPLHLADSRLVKLGEKVFALGFPMMDIQGEEPKFTEGSISSLYGIQDDSARFQISVPLQPGNSGGPLANTAGQVVGIVVAKLAKQFDAENVNYAVKSSRARLIVDDVLGIHLAATEAGVSLTPEQVAERLTESTVLLLIY